MKEEGFESGAEEGWQYVAIRCEEIPSSEAKELPAAGVPD
jgi:hypothetical protein